MYYITIFYFPAYNEVPYSNVSWPDLRGGGKLGSCPGASTTKGPPQKTVKNYCPRKHENISLFDLQETATKFIGCSFGIITVVSACKNKDKEKKSNLKKTEIF